MTTLAMHSPTLGGATAPKFGNTQPLGGDDIRPAQVNDTGAATLGGNGPNGPNDPKNNLFQLISEAVEKILTEIILMARPILEPLSQHEGARNFLYGAVAWVEKRLGLPEENALRNSFDTVMNSFTPPQSPSMKDTGDTDPSPPRGNGSNTLAFA